MHDHPFDGRTALRALTGLDLGLRVRVQLESRQRPIFSGPENRTALHLISELAELVSELRVYSYALRGQLEQMTFALQANAEGGAWRYARRAALDLAGVLALAGKRRLADQSSCVRGANAALRIAELIAREVR